MTQSQDESGTGGIRTGQGRRRGARLSGHSAGGLRARRRGLRRHLGSCGRHRRAPHRGCRSTVGCQARRRQPGIRRRRRPRLDRLTLVPAGTIGASSRPGTIFSGYGLSDRRSRAVHRSFPDNRGRCRRRTFRRAGAGRPARRCGWPPTPTRWPDCPSTSIRQVQGQAAAQASTRESRVGQHRQHADGVLDGQSLHARCGREVHRRRAGRRHHADSCALRDPAPRLRQLRRGRIRFRLPRTAAGSTVSQAPSAVDRRPSSSNPMRSPWPTACRVTSARSAST